MGYSLTLQKKHDKITHKHPPIQTNGGITIAAVRQLTLTACSILDYAIHSQNENNAMNQAVTVVYLDTLFFLNFLLNYLIMLAVARVCALVVRRWRIALAAAVGGVYAVMAIMPIMHFAASLIMQILVAIAMAAIAFGVNKRLTKATLCLWLVGLLFGGAVMGANILLDRDAGIGHVPYIDISIGLLLTSTAAAYVLITVILKASANRAGTRGASMTIEADGKSCTINILHDSGNALTDPVTGAPVLIVTPQELYPLWSPEQRIILNSEQLHDPTAVLLALSNIKSPVAFRLVPYSAIGVECNMLLAFMPDRIAVDGKQTHMLVALSPTSVSHGAYAGIANLG